MNDSVPTPETLSEMVELANNNIINPEYHIRCDVAVHDNVPSYTIRVDSDIKIKHVVHDKNVAAFMLNLYLMGHVAGLESANSIFHERTKQQTKKGFLDKLFGR